MESIPVDDIIVNVSLANWGRLSQANGGKKGQKLFHILPGVNISQNSVTLVTE